MGLREKNHVLDQEQTIIKIGIDLSILNILLIKSKWFRKRLKWLLWVVAQDNGI